jgi:1-acyl-sn-glycerol-3-phosphate acyltransferase
MLSPNLPNYSGTRAHCRALSILRPLARALLRCVHRARVDAGRLPTDGAVIVIANHVSGIDALLLQGWIDRPIRFMMERAQMHWSVGWLWRLIRVIPVDEGAGSAALRESLRELAQGGTVGIFPEGMIERPPGVLLPFRPGLAALARKTRATVAVYVIDGIPPCGNAFVSLVRPSRAQMRLVMVTLPPLTPGDDEAWTQSLRESMSEALSERMGSSDDAGARADTLPSG